VITGGDLVVVGSVDTDGNAVVAVRLSDGSQAWRVPVAGTVRDIVVGDGGNLYVLMPTSMIVLDAATGALRTTYVNVTHVAVDMILSNGVMYIGSQLNGHGAVLTAVPVASQNYDPLSPWPVRFADNQRTSHLPASRLR
jgi:hypothetical protein